MTSYLLETAIALSLLFAFTNGMKDGANVLATAVSSGSVGFGRALLLVTGAELVGPFLFGIPVALTVAQGIMRVDLLPRGQEGLVLILSGIGGAIIWNTACWILRLPTSSSYALVGGLVGPVLVRVGPQGIPWGIFLAKVLAPVILSPFLGIAAGMVVYRLLARLLQNAHWGANRTLKRLQIASLVVLGMNHGTNDSQKTMGLIALLLLLAGNTARLAVPFWVMAASVLCLAAGVTIGGTRIIKTVGYGIFRIAPIHSFSSQLSATAVLMTCNLLGAPVSSTQIISSSVIGVGNACRRGSVRWPLIQNILLGWLITIPMAGAVAAGLYLLLSRIFS